MVGVRLDQLAVTWILTLTQTAPIASSKYLAVELDVKQVLTVPITSGFEVPIRKWVSRVAGFSSSLIYSTRKLEFTRHFSLTAASLSSRTWIGTRKSRLGVIDGIILLDCYEMEMYALMSGEHHPGQRYCTKGQCLR